MLAKRMHQDFLKKGILLPDDDYIIPELEEYIFHFYLKFTFFKIEIVRLHFHDCNFN
jgi:hypothetical protein